MLGGSWATHPRLAGRKSLYVRVDIRSCAMLINFAVLTGTRGIILMSGLEPELSKMWLECKERCKSTHAQACRDKLDRSLERCQSERKSHHDDIASLYGSIQLFNKHEYDQKIVRHRHLYRSDHDSA